MDCFLDLQRLNINLYQIHDIDCGNEHINVSSTVHAYKCVVHAYVIYMPNAQKYSVIFNILSNQT